LNVSDSDWRRLKDQHGNILLGEVAALLHDLGKCTAEFAYHPEMRAGANIEPYRAVFKDSELGAYSFSPARVADRLREARDSFALSRLLSPAVIQALDAILDIDRNPYTLREAIYFARGGGFAQGIANAIGRPADPIHLLTSCHGEAHVEKEPPAPVVTPDPMAIYSPFGFRMRTLLRPGEQGNLTERLNNIDFQQLVHDGKKEALKITFSDAPADTRYPIDEVTLWDWSYAIASLYKSELARHFIKGGWRKREELRWRLLRINFDVLGLYSRAIKLADLFGYVSAVGEACKQTKHFLEDEYPLGNEIYRDTTGIYFTFPDFDLPADLGLELRRIVEEIEPELAPQIHVGAGQGNIAADQLKRMLTDQHSAALEELSLPVGQDNLSPCCNALWENLPDCAWEVCPVCRLRPKQEEAEVCWHCAERRKPRLKAWKENPDRTTIWLDELADENGRIVLVVGKFGLDDWLSGDLVQTLLVRCDPASKSFAPKNPSPARLRRVWETCQKLWENSVPTIFSEHIPDRARWELLPRNAGDVDELPKDEVCDGMLNGKPASVFRIGDHLLTVSYFPEDAPPQPGTLCVSWESRNKRDPLPLAIAEVCKPAGDIERFRTYRPTLTLLTSPDQFMAFTPASAAVDLAEKIKNAYAREFGKVQDRLPLFLGLVFFHRKAPLFAAIDTARRMLLEVELRDEQWKVECSCPSPDGQHHRLRLSNSSNHMDYDVPVKMGDKQTEDVWYPYLFVESQTDNRSRRFQVKEGKYAGRWLMHASGLRPEDKVRVWPSRFGYKFLEHSAQRFEFDPRRNIMCLDELPRLTKMWSEIRKTTDMTDTRLRGVASLLEAKKDNWGNDSEEFRLLAETTLKQAKLLGDKPAVTPEDVICGRFGRCLELHLRILKQRVKGESDAEPVFV
jgi:hypothetical protein